MRHLCCVDGWEQRAFADFELSCKHQGRAEHASRKGGTSSWAQCMNEPTSGGAVYSCHSILNNLRQGLNTCIHATHLARQPLSQPYLKHKGSLHTRQQASVPAVVGLVACLPWPTVLASDAVVDGGVVQRPEARHSCCCCAVGDGSQRACCLPVPDKAMLWPYASGSADRQHRGLHLSAGRLWRRRSDNSSEVRQRRDEQICCCVAAAACSCRCWLAQWQNRNSQYLNDAVQCRHTFTQGARSADL